MLVFHKLNCQTTLAPQKKTGIFRVLKPQSVPFSAKVYINHGGGPLPLLGKQPGIAEFLGSYAGTLPRKPTAILVVTAHWETGSQLKVSGGKALSLYFDYGGFPKATKHIFGGSYIGGINKYCVSIKTLALSLLMSKTFHIIRVSFSIFPVSDQESYEYTYPAPGSPELANRIISLLAEKGLRCTADASRGWDHGVFVPLMLMFPEASVPVVSMSLYSSQDASQHMEAGEALQGLRDEGVLIVGSGASFHNFGYFFVSWCNWLVISAFCILCISLGLDFHGLARYWLGMAKNVASSAGQRRSCQKQRREALTALSQLARRNCAVREC